MEKSKKGKASASFEVAANFQGLTKEQGEARIAAYVFDRAGNLLGKEPLKFVEGTTAKASFEIEAERENLLVKIGPDVDDTRVLERYQPSVGVVVPDKTEILDMLIPDKTWFCWLKVPYVVRGDVKKYDENGNSPICYGNVDIFDVDVYYCILKLPDLVIERIRDSVLDIIIDPPPLVQRFEEIPEDIYQLEDDDYDWCGTMGRRVPVPPKPYVIEKKFEVLPEELQFISRRYKSLSTAKARMDDAVKKMSVIQKSNWLNTEMLEGIKVSKILNTNTLQFRNLLIDKFQVFRFYLCWYPWIYWLWWPFCRFYTLEKLGTAALKPDGSFEKTIWVSICRKDIPDLWFVVRQKINGIEKIIYRRYPIPCNTYWNHPSGKPVHLAVTDPDAVACQQPPQTDQDDDELWIVPLAVGNYSLKRVFGTGAGTLPADNAKIGLYETISTSVGSFDEGPFGGGMELRYLFSRGLETSGVRYYRIKARTNGTGDWVPLTHDVVRHYSHYDPVVESLTFLPYQLGPQTVGTENALFEICPRETPLQASEPDSDWYDLDAHVDRVDAYYNSSAVTDGYVEFKIELFNAGGVRVNPATFGTGGIEFRLPNNTDIWNAVTTIDPALVNPALLVPDPEAPAFQTFIFRLRINHEAPNGSVAEVEAYPSGAKANACGVLRYTPTDTSITMTYSAWHTHGFARYYYSLYRSTSDKDLLYSANGDVGTSSVTGQHSVPAPQKNITNLMGTCPMAAFSENLSVYHMAYNGWNRVGGMDKHYDRPFVLAPEA